jgi:hypothetical protein
MNGDNSGIDNMIPDTSTEAQETQETKQDAGQIQQPQIQTPKYFSQLKKEIAENEDVKKYAGSHADLNDLVNDYTTSKKTLENALVFPGKDATQEQIAEFFGKLGVPKDTSGYTLNNYDMKEEDVKVLKDSFLQAAHKAALSNKQAQHMWAHIIATSKAGIKQIADNAQKTKDAFDPQYHKLMEKEYPVEAERVTAIKGEISLARAFMQRTGIGDAVTKSGLIYDPAFIHAIAQEEKSHKPSIIEGSDEIQKKQEGGMSYGKEFQDFIGA